MKTKDTIQLGYRIEKKVKEEFDKICEEKFFNGNKIVEKLMKDFIQEHQK